ELVRSLRENSARYVIDPTSVLTIRQWKQDDYRFFWGRVIETLVDCVVFRNGWEWSSGCCYEFFVASSGGIRLLTEDLQPLSLGRARTLVSDVLESEMSASFDPSLIRAVSEELGNGNHPSNA